MSEPAVEVRHSVCPLDCPDTCSLAVSVQNDEIIAIKGSDATPYTDNVICKKVAKYYPDFIHGSKRLRQPLLRNGARGSGAYTAISWDDAIERIYQRFSEIIEQDGAQAIVPFNYSGPHGMLANGSMDYRFFHRLGASLLARRPLCAGTWDEAWSATFGAVPGIPPEQVLESKLVVVWGHNTAISALHLHRLIRQAARQGCKVIVVDPVRTKIAAQADLHLAINPATDVVLAFALATEIEKNGGFDTDFIARHVAGFDVYMEQARNYSVEEAAIICGLDAADIRSMARMYQQYTPAAMTIGVAPERNRNGGAGLRSVFALPALCGKFGVTGGGIIGQSSSTFPKTPQKLRRDDLLQSQVRTINILDLPAKIDRSDDGIPVTGIFIYNHNPLAVHPEQNRMRAALDNEAVFIVGSDVTMTDSMQYADIILPACSHFEHTEVFPAYGQTWLQKAGAVIPAVGEALPNTEIFRRLAQRFGFDDACFHSSDQSLIRDSFDHADEQLSAAALTQLDQGKAVKMKTAGEDHVLFHNVWPATPSGKVELFSIDLQNRFDAGMPQFLPPEYPYPLTLITPSSQGRTNSTFGGVGDNTGTELIDMHPDDAAARTLADGDRVVAWNELGRVELALHITRDVKQGVVRVAKGCWNVSSSTGQTVNALIPGYRSDIGDGACYNDASIEVSSAD